MKLGIFTDPHYCNKEITCVTRRSLLSYQKIKEAMEHFAKESVDAVICLGDLIDDCDTYQGNVEYARKLTELISGFNIPFYCLMGNHDHLDFTREDFARITGATPPFSVIMGDSLLVFLDCNHHDDGEPYSPKRADWTNSYLPKAQLDELERVLGENKDKKAYIFSHQPLENTLEPVHTVRNGQAVRDVFKKAGNVKRSFAGHFHPGNETVIDGVTYTTLPAMCEGEQNRYFVVDI